MTALALDVRFVLGRYHATPWDRHVNDGAIEWPPTPWRLTRALYCVWKERCPELERDAVMEALGVAATPAVIDLPPSAGASTRHYYPQSDRLFGSVGTSKVIDAFVAVDPGTALRLRWDRPITEQGRAAFNTLVDHLTYLGRADSCCEAELVELEGAPDVEPGWRRWSPDPAGEDRLMAPRLPLDEAGLIISTDDMRRARHLSPPGAAMATYRVDRSPERDRTTTPISRPSAPTCMVLGVAGSPNPPITMSIVVADWIRTRALKSLSGADGHSSLSGHHPDRSVRDDQHQHAHFVPVCGVDGRISAIAVWAPEGLDADAVSALASLGHLGPRDETSATYRVKGVAAFDVFPVALGDADVLPWSLRTPTRIWESVTPFVPARHQKDRRYSGERVGPYFRSFLVEEVERELAFRGVPAPVHVSIVEGRMPAQRFRRHRVRESLADARPGVMLRLEWHEPVRGPVALGRHSHFGLGLFTAPEHGDSSGT